jgi:hypothetical protein
VDELVERAREGDRDAFASLVQLTSDRMYAIATRILRDSHRGVPLTTGDFVGSDPVEWRPVGLVPAISRGRAAPTRMRSLQ